MPNQGKTYDELKELQALPLDDKIEMSKDRIIEWYEHWNGQVAVSVSGGKDSAVLLHLVRSIYPDCKAVFSDTGIEYPEIRQFARAVDNLDIARPQMTFKDVITEYGYPIISKEVAEAIYYARRRIPEIANTANRKKAELLPQIVFDEKDLATKESKYIKRGRPQNVRRLCLLGYAPNPLKEKQIMEFADLQRSRSKFNKQRWLPLALNAPFRISNYCCEVFKKSPLKKYHRKTKTKPYIGILAEESSVRFKAWLSHGCNAFEGAKKQSNPLAFWTEQDILEYIARYNIPICSVYGDVVKNEDGTYRTTGVNRTGCIYCAFGLYLESGENRFQKLKKTHPRLYDYCIGGGQWIDNPDYDPTLSDEPDELGWIEWNPKKIWIPSNEGIGMGFVIDKCNEIYGKELMTY